MHNAGLICRALDRAAARRSNADHAMPFLVRFVDQIRGRRRYIVPLRMHGVLFHIIHLYRAEGSQAHMERHKSDLHPLCPDLIEQFRGKVEACRGRCSGPLVLCVYGLVAVPVPELVSDIGRQGHLTETVEHLDLAFFRGFSVVQPIWEGDEVRHVSLLESWNFLFGDDKRLLWNPDCSLDPSACFEIPAAARIVQVRRRRPIDYPALAIHIRKYLGERDWGRFIERYGIPPVDVVMAPNATNENRDEYVEAADRARDGLSTVWPSGSSTSRAEGSRGQDPFSAFIEHQEKLIVLRATGGTLTSLAQADTGSLAGGAQMEVWDQIVQRDSSLISDALNRQLFWHFLERRFPGRTPAVEFSIGREREVTAADAADLAVKLHGAGYLVDQAELEEATGFTLEKSPETPPQGGLGGLSLNKKPKTPLQNDVSRLQNAPRVSDGQGDPSGEDALVEALSGLFEKSLAEVASEAVEKEEKQDEHGTED